MLDVGAGTGRVALDLAARGVEVVALDLEPELLEALDERARAARPERRDRRRRRPRRSTLGDARFGLIAVPMQTLQLLDGAAGARRSSSLPRGARLRPGGLVAVALADALESFDGESDGLPEPDIGRGRRRPLRRRCPLAVVDEGDRAAIHRLRQVVGISAASTRSTTSSGWPASTP